MAERQDNPAAADPAPQSAPGVAVATPAVAHLTTTVPGWTVYEVNAEIDPQRIADFDAWLPDHVDRVLKLSQFASADILVRDDVGEGPRTGWARRVIQYQVRDAAQLQDYLALHAPDLRADAIARFGESVWFERRVLTHSAHRTPGEVKLEYCANCGGVLTGQYCASCGQRSRVRIISLWHLIREAAGDLTHLDSRLWRTMRPLLLRPGVLTNEYLAGRRMRFIPPFRLYLGLSIVFFVLASLGSGPPGVALNEQELTAEDRAELERAAREIPFPIPGLPVPPTPPATQTADGGNDAHTASAADKDRVRATLNVTDCDNWRFSANVPGRAAFESRLQRACTKIAPDNGREFLHALGSNIPKMMFVFLPLLALANKLLYPLSRRYYVEHLLFFVHFHAVAFLLFSLRTLFNLATGSIAWLEAVRGLLLAAIVIYVPIYLYKALRRVYQQSRLATVFKFSLLFVAYMFCLIFTLLGVVLYTALTL